MVKKQSDTKEKIDELNKKLAKLRDELFKTRIEHFQGKLKNTSILTAKRKEIARALTAKRQLENFI